MIDIPTLKTRLDIAAVLRDRGFQLEARGENLFMLCPFHREDSASLSVNVATGLWKCFGCGVGGDVITFVQKLDGISAWEAAKKLCAQYFPDERLVPGKRSKSGALETITQTETPADRPSKETLDHIVGFWQKNLAGSRKAKEYLERRRLWSPELLRALRIGISNGRLLPMLPQEGKIRESLRTMGILNKKGNETFYNRLLIPLFDENDMLVGLYGRALEETSTVPHLYLKGPRRGVFHRAGIPEDGSVFLTESLIDALSLLTLGLTNVTTSYGVNSFTPELRQLLVERRVTRVFCVYDADEAGDTAADELARDLAGEGIPVLRMRLPVKDVNAFLAEGGTREGFDALVEQVSRSVTESTPPSTPTPLTLPADTAPTFTFGERTYEIQGDPERSKRTLEITLKVTGHGKRPFLDTLNLYSDTARTRLQGRLFTHFRGLVEKTDFEEDLFAILEFLESQLSGPEEPEGLPTMTPEEAEEAESFLRRPDLIPAIIEDIAHLGVVGEEDNKILAYLVATSRKLNDPVSLSVISRSSAGKSWLINRVVDLMPPEDVFRYTRMSPRALFYNEPAKFKHKILFIEEAIGAKDADLGVRSIQSERRLSNLATMTDPKTGKLTTQENVVEGPLTYLTSSTEPLDDETETRSFEIAIDESAAQTKRIVTNLFHRRTLEGIQGRLDRDAIVKRHQNAQRLLEPIWTVNPYGPQLTFPTETLRLRRECDKYLSLIETLAFLHQKQRPVKTFLRGKEKVRYIEVSVEEIDRANRLTVKCLARALSGLPGPTQELLIQIRNLVVEKAEGGPLLEVRFTRAQIRESSGWTSERQLLDAIGKLIGLEYVCVISGSFGKEYLYTLAPDHRLVVQSTLPVEKQILELGLTPAENLVPPETFSGTRQP